MQAIDLIISYITEEHKKLDAIFERMTDADLDANISGEETIRARIEHTIRSEVGMLRYLDGDLDVDSLEQNLDFSTVESVKKSSAYAKEQHIKLISSLSEDDLDKVMSSPNGKEFAYHYITYHMLQHLIEHRGQLAMRLREIQDQ